MSLGLILVRALELVNRGSASTSSIKKTRRYETPVRKLHPVMTVMYAIFAVLISVGLITYLILIFSLSWLPYFFYVAHYEVILGIKKYMKYEKKTGG